MPRPPRLHGRRHPVVGILAVRGIPKRELARATGYDDVYLTHVLNGIVRPSAKLRAAVAAELGKPEGELFYPWPGDAA